MTARPYTDTGLELEDRLDDLLSEPPAEGWAAVLNSLELRVPGLAPDTAAEVVTGRAVAPLFAALLEDAVASCPSAELLQPLALSTSFSPELVRQIAAGVAAELRASGVSVLVLPALRLIGGATGDQAFFAAGYGSEPYLAGRVVAALLRGAAGTAEARGVAVVLETAGTLQEDRAEPDRWREQVFELLAVAVRDGRARGLLLDRLPKPELPAATLRDALGDDSLLLLADARELPAEPLGELLAALDVEALLPPIVDVEAPAVREALRWAETLGEREQKRRAARLLRLKLSLGLFDLPLPTALPRPDSAALRGRLALASMVQLVNETAPDRAPLLPLLPAAAVQVFVSRALGPALLELLAVAFRESTLNSTLIPVAAALPEDDLETGQDRLLATAAAGDVALWITPAADPGPLVLQTLRSLSTPLMVVAVGPDAAFPVQAREGVAALVQCFGPAGPSLEQLPAVLTGDRLATGRLPHALCAPAFPFGCGAAGSPVLYDTLSGPTSADTSSVVVLTQTLTNPGSRTVVEVPQLYRRGADSEDALLGFARCTLNPGETLSIRFQLDTSLLAAVAEDGSWLVAPGLVSLYVGAAAGRPESSLAIELRGAERRLKQHQRVSTLSAIESVGRSEEH